MPSAVRVLLVSAATTALAVSVGVVVHPPDQSAPPAATPATPAAPEADPTVAPLEEVETGGLTVVRAPFCAGIADEAVEVALGREPVRSTAWENGEEVALTPRLTDVAHEHGCSWAAGRTTARGWVFAPPVTAGRARQLVRSATAGGGCGSVADAPDFGRPGAALVCERSGAREASYRGLFGDAWLVCTLTDAASRDRADLLDRASRWCAAVVTTATGGTVPG